MVRGYKIFNPDWTCRGKQYKCPGMFHENVEPKLCETGMHFSVDIKDCFRYYIDADSTYHMVEVIAHGRVDVGDNKCCTDDLEIVREIPWAEVLKIVNIGKDCTGVCNTGDWNARNQNTGNCNAGSYNTGSYNTENWNVGSYNTGSYNTGNWNAGNWNAGSSNTGDCNVGDWNAGKQNTGNYNTGDRNTGDWNATYGSSGCFNTAEQPIMMFNKPSGWTLRDWLKSDARYCLIHMPKNVVEWVCSTNMTEDEKAAHPEYETTGGYLKTIDGNECVQSWWDGLDEHKRFVITSLPNFDAEIFRECTGIDVNMTKETE